MSNADWVHAEPRRPKDARQAEGWAAAQTEPARVAESMSVEAEPVCTSAEAEPGCMSARAVRASCHRAAVYKREHPVPPAVWSSPGCQAGRQVAKRTSIRVLSRACPQDAERIRSEIRLSDGWQAALPDLRSQRRYG